MELRQARVTILRVVVSAQSCVYIPEDNGTARGGSKYIQTRHSHAFPIHQRLFSEYVVIECVRTGRPHARIPAHQKLRNYFYGSSSTDLNRRLDCDILQTLSGLYRNRRQGGAPDLCVMQVPPAYFHFYSMPGSIGHLF
jgi:hypothetical protein